jgi:hypothetical protein
MILSRPSSLIENASLKRNTAPQKLETEIKSKNTWKFTKKNRIQADFLRLEHVPVCEFSFCVFFH